VLERQCSLVVCVCCGALGGLALRFGLILASGSSHSGKIIQN
jgi:hypothetical protein